MVWGQILGAVGGYLSSKNSADAAQEAAEGARFSPYDVFGPNGSSVTFSGGGAGGGGSSPVAGGLIDTSSGGIQPNAYLYNSDPVYRSAWDKAVSNHQKEFGQGFNQYSDVTSLQNQLNNNMKANPNYQEGVSGIVPEDKLNQVTGGNGININRGGSDQTFADLFQTRAMESLTGGGGSGHFSDALQSRGASGILNANGSQEGLYNNAIMQSLFQSGALGDSANFLEGAGMAGISQALGRTPSADGLTGFAAGQAQDLLNSPSNSFNGLAASRLKALRDQSRLGEERAVNSTVNNLFSKGRLGTEGGARALGELSTQQEIQDQSRIINSQDFANSQLNQNRSLGSSMLGQAFGGIGQDQNVSLGLGNLSQGLFSQANNTRGASMDALNFGLSSGQQRLVNANSLFGLGRQINQDDINQGMQLLGGSQTIDSNLMDFARIGASAGQAQAAANANAGTFLTEGAFSGAGAALSGIGNSGIIGKILDQ